MANSTSGYRPKASRQTRTVVEIMQPTYAVYHGVRNVTYESGGLTKVNWKSFGGTVGAVDGVLSVIDTAQVTMRWRPDIKAGTCLKKTSGAVYEIKGEPENVDEANLWLTCRVERVKGEGGSSG